MAVNMASGGGGSGVFGPVLKVLVSPIVIVLLFSSLFQFVSLVKNLII